MSSYWQQLGGALERGQKFIRHDVWQIGKPGERVPSGFIIKHIRVSILLVRGLIEETLLLRASALTFATMLFIVPFLAFMFAFIQWFNLGDEIYSKLSASINKRLVDTIREWDRDDKPAAEDVTNAPVETAPPGVTATPQEPPPVTAAEAPPVTVAQVEDPAQKESHDKELIDRFVKTFLPGVDKMNSGKPGQEYLDPVEVLVQMAQEGATNPRALGISSIIYILTTVLGLMRNVEWSFNRIWGVDKSRDLFRTLSDYIMITLLLPFVVAFVLGLTAALASPDVSAMLGSFTVVLRAGQVAIVWLTFTLIYYMVPNTQVKFRYALLGGFTGATLWLLLSWAYLNFQIGLANYTLFFSTFAMIPLLLFWVYSSWVIILFGALVTFAYQNEQTFALERLANRAPYAYKEALAVRTAIEIGHRFNQGLAAFTVASAAAAWNVPSRLLNETLANLIDANLVTACATEPVTYQPARSPEHTFVRDVVRAMRDHGRNPSQLRDEDAYHDVYGGLDAGDDDYLNKPLSALADRLREKTASETPPATLVSFGESRKKRLE